MDETDQSSLREIEEMRRHYLESPNKLSASTRNAAHRSPSSPLAIAKYLYSIIPIHLEYLSMARTENKN